MNTQPKSRILSNQKCPKRRLNRGAIPPIVREQQTSNKRLKFNFPLKLILRALIACTIVFGLLYLIFFFVLPQLKNAASYIASSFNSLISDTSDFLSDAPIYSSIDLTSDSSLKLGTLLATNPKSTIIARISSGDTLNSLLSRYVVDKEKASLIHEKFITFFENRKETAPFISGQKISLQLNSEGELSTIKIPYREKSYVLISTSNSDNYSVEILNPDKNTRERVVVGAITHSFAASAKKAGLSYDVIDRLADLFGDRIAFHRDFRKGDRFTVIYDEEHYSDGSKSETGQIHAAAFQVRGKLYAAIHFVGSDGKGRYFNEKGELLENTFLRYPVKFSRISSHFSRARFHPVLKVKRPHNGVDFAAPTGTPVRTTANGTVTFAGRKGGNGILVKIKHTERYTTGYAHLSGIAKGVKRGTQVERGQLIGYVGMTGLATGPHLHFSLYDRGKYVDPLKVDLPQATELKKGTKINKSYLQRAVFSLKSFQKLEISDS